MKTKKAEFQSTLFIIIILLILGGCSSASVRKTSGGYFTAKDRQSYEQGIKLLTSGNYSQAADAFSTILKNDPDSRWRPSLHYNLGLSYEGMEKYNDAAASFQKVIDFYEGLRTREEADALYHLAVCREMTGQDDLALAALLQLQEQVPFLTPEQLETEIPARIAGDYARLGNLEQAQKYFAKSEAAIRALRRSRPKRELDRWLPKTLYSMGRLPPPGHDTSLKNFKNYVAALETAQPRLLEAAAIEGSPWAKKAADELMSAYDRVWDWVEKVDVGYNDDVIQRAKARQDLQREMATDLNVVIERLRMERIPPSPQEPEPPLVTQIFKNISVKQRQVELVLQARDVQDQDTIEAQKRQSLKKPGIIRPEVKRK